MRPYEDIIHPMLKDYTDRIVQIGYSALDPYQISYLNDFIYYLNEEVPNQNFAFYPLRKSQNAGSGITGLGMGNMGSGCPIIFRNSVQWMDSGIYLGDTLNNCGEINLTPLGFQFRRDTSTIFYVFKHERSENEEVAFGRETPYFCFDRPSLPCADHFTIKAPIFSTDSRRPRGTTIIYDEIFGLDQKGFSIDYSKIPSNTNPQPVSFYSLKNNFVTLNLYSDFNKYILRTISGVDDTILTGQFLQPYLIIRTFDNNQGEEENPTPQYLMPSRMVLGAGIENTSELYDVLGTPQTCAAVLIISGDYRHKANEINHELYKAINVITQPEPYLFENSERISLYPHINNIEYGDNPIQATEDNLPIAEQIFNFGRIIGIEYYLEWINFLSGIIWNFVRKVDDISLVSANIIENTYITGMFEGSGVETISSSGYINDFIYQTGIFEGSGAEFLAGSGDISGIDYLIGLSGISGDLEEIYASGNISQIDYYQSITGSTTGSIISTIFYQSTGIDSINKTANTITPFGITYAVSGLDNINDTNMGTGFAITYSISGVGNINAISGGITNITTSFSGVSFGVSGVMLSTGSF